ncbi:magnesium transporter MgtE N-terminal domain-containing protein [Clostridium fallax]|uniref:PRC-barrel domain-containing protein n=1 Tax=Clostridium fallax TaxID=1533 RepID=A0A1M4SS82_9CLOT|nr:CBS domain-containing protein [Clostridium fallax]SHE35059.1 PRC-barrel domain-containing protein [Clostridium fallax]SQB07945.1 CBS domain-containing protein [Clostridium fallax]
MKKLSVFLFSNILNKKIYDEFDDVLGILKDVYVTTEDGYPRIIGYRVKIDNSIFDYEFRYIGFYMKENGKIRIQSKGGKEILPRNYSYLLSHHLLDKKIVDINGKKVVRVNDLRIAEIAGEYRVVAVETGNLVKFRRKGIERLGKIILKLLGKDTEDRVLMWDDVESLEMVNDALQIQVPYKKLSTLHPADLADILEELDDKQRKRIFEVLDDDLVADALEEIEPEYKGEFIKELSDSKALEVLENMPNDEIAEFLEELDEDERERILFNLENEDVEEIKELLRYGDESVGSIMNKDFISFNMDLTVGDTVALLKETEPEEEVMYYIYITDEEERLQGVVDIRDLVMANNNVNMKEIMKKSDAVLKDNLEIDEAVELITKYDLFSIPVLDNEDKLVGVVLMHDIIDEILLPAWKKKREKKEK